MSRRNPTPTPRRTTKITVPDRVGPHVKLLFTEMRRQNITYDEVEIGSGVRRAALKAWRHKNRPNLDSIEAALGFLGWDFVPVPRAKVLPPEIVEELRDVAARLDSTVPATVQALVEIVTGIHARFGERPSANPPAGASDAREPRQAPAKRRPRAIPHPDQGALPGLSHAVH